MLRIATAIVMLPLVWGLIRYTPPWAFTLVIAAAGSIGAWECYRLLGARGARPVQTLGLPATWSLVASAFFAEEIGVELPLVLTTILTLVVAMGYRARPSEMLETVLKTLFPVLYIGLGLSFMVRMRLVPGDGRDLLVVLFLCVFATDTFSYWTGTAWGRTKLAPGLSPNKTWEGFAGGLAGCLVAMTVLHLLFPDRLPLASALGLGGLLAAASLFGDLAESVVKRAGERKDSSSLFPGHGGLLDRTDSLLFAAPVLYYYYWAFLRGIV